MIRNLKILGLAIAAAMALSAVSAAGAQAIEFTAGKYPASVTGEQLEYEGSSKYVFRAGDTKISCGSAQFAGELTKAATQLTIVPVYQECIATPGNRQTTVTMNGCHYVYSGGTSTGEDHFINGSLELACPAGKTVGIDIFASAAKHLEGKALCTITVSPFKELTPNTYTNVTGKPADIQVVSRTTRLPIAIDGAPCGSATTGSYEGASTLHAHNAGNQIDLSVSGGEEGGFSSTEIAGEQIEHAGSSQHLFTFGSKEVVCGEAVLSGTVEEAPKEAEPKEMTLQPTYRNCIFEEFFPATIVTNGCDYLFHVESGGVGHYTGSVDFKCPAGAAIEVRVYTSVANHEANVPTCSYKLFPKEGLKTITYENTGESPDDVRMTTGLSGLPIEVIGPKIFCGAATTASYTGALTLRGYVDEALTDQVDLTVGP